MLERLPYGGDSALERLPYGGDSVLERLPYGGDSALERLCPQIKKSVNMPMNCEYHQISFLKGWAQRL